MSKIGIIGFGYVGNAIAQGFGLVKDIQIKIHDIKEEVDSFEDVVDNSDIIFLALPTPMVAKEGGPIDLSIIEEVVEQIAERIKDKIIVIKSTVIPGTTRKLQKKYPDLNFIFNPEFLTARNARLDFINTARIILGGKTDKDPNLEIMENLYRERFTHTPILKTNYETAEFIKYLCNNFFSTKVMYFNEQYQVAQKYNEISSNKISWYDSITALLMDGRIGNSHTDIPGHDGELGFSGSCFPKDICAYREWAKSIGAETPILNEAWEENKRIRKNWDWAENPSAVTRKKDEER